MKKLLLSPIWSIIILLLCTYGYYTNPNLLESLRLRYFDSLIVNQPIQENNIYTVNIDDATINQYGQWPFPRNIYADIIKDLYDRGAGLVVFNVLMSESDRFEKDEVL